MNKVLISIFMLFTGVETSYAGDLSGSVTCKGVRSNAGAVIYLEKVNVASETTAGDTVLMNQENLKFYPHILPITVGTTVEFLNSDDVLHNVFSPDACAMEFNLGTWPKGEKRSATFSEEGCYSVVLCNVHPEMEAWIIVLQNKYYAVTDENGSYSITGIPPGKYNIVAWHERLKKKTVQVDIAEENTATADFTLSRR